MKNTLNRDTSTDYKSSFEPGAREEIKRSRSTKTQILRTFAINMVVALVVFCGAFLAGNKFFFTVVRVNGTSMAPTLSHGDMYVLNKLSYTVRDPRIGEVVVFRDPDDSLLSIKRVIGAPGDILSIQNGKVYRNDVEIAEPYLATNTMTFMINNDLGTTFTLEEGQFFLLGDNRDNSLDSRSYGSVDKSNILGLINKS